VQQPQEDLCRQPQLLFGLVKPCTPCMAPSSQALNRPEAGS
jgi:hypothetical protein